MGLILPKRKYFSAGGEHFNIVQYEIMLLREIESHLVNACKALFVEDRPNLYPSLSI